MPALAPLAPGAARLCIPPMKLTNQCDQLMEGATAEAW